MQKILFRFAPVYYFIPVIYIIRSFIEIIEVVCVLPYIQGEDRAKALLNGAVLVGRCHDPKSAAPVNEPRIAGAENGERGVFKQFIKILHTAEAAG